MPLRLQAACVAPATTEFGTQIRVANRSPGFDPGDAPITFRLAIGLFSDAAPLRDALSVMSDQGLASQNYCLVGTQGDDSENANFSNDCLAGYFSRARSHVGFACRAAIDRAPSALCASCIAAPLTGNAPASWWLSPVQSQRLLDHLRSGGLILIVSSRTPAEQDATSRILLRHSKHGVQTHDFTLRNTGELGHHPR